MVVPVSIEGSLEDTDELRQACAHQTALRGFGLLSDARECVSFAATATAANAGHVAGDASVDEMIAIGCSVGYLTEYVPCGPIPIPDWVLNAEARATVRQHVLDLWCRKPIVLIQFPDDGYGHENRC